MSKRQKKAVAKSDFPFNGLCLLVIGCGIIYALALGAYRERTQSDTFGQKTHMEHRSPLPQASTDEVALNRLIDESVAKAEARKVPKTAIAMLELYGTPKESEWATRVAKGE